MASSWNLAYLPFGVAAAHWKLRKLWKTWFVASGIDLVLFWKTSTLCLAFAAWGRVPFAVIKSKVRFRTLSLARVLSLTRVFIGLIRRMLVIRVVLLCFFWNLLLLLLFRAFFFVFLIIVKLISTVLILLESLLEIFLVNFLLMFQLVSFNQWFYFAFSFFLEMIHSGSLILTDVVKVRGLVIFSLFELLQLLDILLVQIKLIKKVFLRLFLFLVTFFDHWVWLFCSTFLETWLKPFLVFGLVQSLSNLGIIKMHDIASGSVSGLLLIHWFWLFVAPSSITQFGLSTMWFSDKEVILLF